MDDRFIWLNKESKQIAFYKFDKDSAIPQRDSSTLPWKLEQLDESSGGKRITKLGLLYDLRAKRGDRSSHTVITWHREKEKCVIIVWDVKTGEKRKAFKIEVFYQICIN